MKLGEIKLEALRIMNINHDEVLLLDRIDEYKGEKKYAKYLNNMLHAINKAIDIINHRKVLPQKRIEMADLPIKSGAINNRYDTTAMNDYLSVDRIVYEDTSSYKERVSYEVEGDMIVVSNKYLPQNLALIYDTKINNIDEDLVDTQDVPGMEGEVARIIPYYIKFELYQEDEPDLALAAKSTFEQEIEGLRVFNNSYESFSIDKVFSSEDYE